MSTKQTADIIKENKKGGIIFDKIFLTEIVVVIFKITNVATINT